LLAALEAADAASVLSRARRRWNVMKFHITQACSKNIATRQLTLIDSKGTNLSKI